MGRKDNALRGYLNRPEVFEELFNVGVYGGRKIVSAQCFAEMQNAGFETFRNRHGKRRRTVRVRDAVKALWIDGHLAILAVECQAEVNYCMPLRCMEYDVEEFIRQVRHIRRHYEEKGGLNRGAEFLSGMKKTDKLIPVFTILLYHGRERWEAAESLRDMVDLTGFDEKMRIMHPDYKLHMVNMMELDAALFETGLRELIGMLQCADDKKKMQQFMKENAKRFRNMDDELYDLICMMAGLGRLEGNKEKYKNNGKGTYDMCVAFEEMMKDSREEGKREGRKEGKREGKKEGKKEGEARLGALIGRLYQDNRSGEVLKAAQNVRFRNRLYREYGI